MLKIQKAVEDFHKAMNQPVGETPMLRDIKLRKDLIKEEYEETIEALEANDLPEAIKEMCDLLYVIAGTAVAAGVDLEPFFDAVHESNMLKSTGPVRADGKRLKPEGWQPPPIREMLIKMYPNIELPPLREFHGNHYCVRLVGQGDLNLAVINENAWKYIHQGELTQELETYILTKIEQAALDESKRRYPQKPAEYYFKIEVGIFRRTKDGSINDRALNIIQYFDYFLDPKKYNSFVKKHKINIVDEYFGHIY